MTALLQNLCVGLVVGAAVAVLLRRCLPRQAMRRAVGHVLVRVPSHRVRELARRLLTPSTPQPAAGCGAGCPSCGGCALKKR